MAVGGSRYPRPVPTLAVIVEQLWLQLIYLLSLGQHNMLKD